MKYAGFTLDPFQERAIEALERGHSVIVAAPTGAGKTLIAEYAIEQALRLGKQVVYTAPIKALSNQKFRDFSARYPGRVGILTGDVSINYRAPAMIMTTEVLRNTLLEDPGRLAAVEFAVFDEFHYIHDYERGTVWEESVIFAPPGIRFVCLSATMPNIEELAGWMREVREGEVEVIAEEKRPVPLDHHIWADGYGLRALGSFHQLTRDLASGTRIVRRRRLGSEALIGMLEREGRLPCLYFCFNRRLCEQRAEANAGRKLLSKAEAQQVGRLFDELVERFDVAGEPSAILLGELVRRGVAFHHAGMLPTLKEVVERLFTSGLVKLLFATETFALGVNMPAQSVVLDSIEKYHGTHFGYLRCREYQQMAGRAGRRGMDERGFVYARVDTDEVTFEGVKRVVAGKPEPIESQFNLSYASILNLYERWGERLHEVCDRSFAAYQQRRRRGRRHPGLRQQVQSRLEVLRALGYLKRRRLTERGRFAARIPGHELQLAELYHSGILLEPDPHGLNVLVSAIVHEARRGGRRGGPHRQLLPNVRRRAERVIRNIYKLERHFAVADPARKLDFGLGMAVLAWSKGAEFGDVASFTTAAEGDIIRTLRMTIQLLRQLRKATDDETLRDKLARAERAINRGPVDAERQLRAGCEEPPPDEEQTTEAQRTQRDRGE